MTFLNSSELFYPIPLLNTISVRGRNARHQKSNYSRLCSKSTLTSLQCWTTLRRTRCNPDKSPLWSARWHRLQRPSLHAGCKRLRMLIRRRLLGDRNERRQLDNRRNNDGRNYGRNNWRDKPCNNASVWNYAYTYNRAVSLEYGGTVLYTLSESGRGGEQLSVYRREHLLYDIRRQPVSVHVSWTN